MWEKHLNALLALLLAVILWGAFGIQFFKHEQPCPLCLLQRLGMLGVAAGALMNVKFKPHKFYYGLSLLSAAFGGFVALRHIFLHICPGFPTFGHPFWGLSLYTWSFIIFACTIVYIALLLIFFDSKEPPNLKEGRLNWWGQLAFVLTFLVALTNIFMTLHQCGLSVCADVL